MSFTSTCFTQDRVVIQDFYLATPRHPFFKWFLDDRMRQVTMMLMMMMMMLLTLLDLPLALLTHILFTIFGCFLS